MTILQNPAPAVKAPVPVSKPSGVKPRAHMALRLDRTGPDARRQAAAVLDVLAGVRTPTEVAKALAISLVAYYKLEARALEGLVRGCEPAARGPRPSPEVEVRRLQREGERLQREVHRYQALARAAQRASGLSAPAPAAKTDAKGRRHRRPTVRALKAARTIREQPEPPVPPPAAPAPVDSVIEGGAT
jgi:hypothetical protein